MTNTMPTWLATGRFVAGPTRQREVFGAARASSQALPGLLNARGLLAPAQAAA